MRREDARCRAARAAGAGPPQRSNGGNAAPQISKLSNGETAVVMESSECLRRKRLTGMNHGRIEAR